MTGALAIMSAGFFLITITQPAGLDPPPETAALFLVSVALASLGYLLLTHGAPKTGIRIAILTGVYVMLSVGVVVSGVYGAGGPKTNPIGPAAWLLLSVAVVATKLMSHREPKT